MPIIPTPPPDDTVPPNMEMTEHGQWVLSEPPYSAGLPSDRRVWWQTPPNDEWDEHDSL